jgi:integrase
VSRGSVKRWRGSAMYAIRIDTTDTPRRQPQRRGFSSLAAAGRELDNVRELLRVGEDDEDVLRSIGDLIFEATRRGGQLPTPDEVRRKLNADLDPAAPSMTVARWLDDWLDAKDDVGPTTRMLLRHRVERFFKPHLGHITLDRLHYRHVRAMFKWIDGRNEVIEEVHAAREDGDRSRPVPPDPLDLREHPRVVGDVVQLQLRASLMDALGQAARLGLLPRQRFDMMKEMVSLRKVRRKKRVIWSPEEARAFLAYAYDRDPRLAPAFELALRRGLRKSELCGLTWADVDWQAGFLVVGRQRQYVGGESKVLVHDTKTQGSDREVPLGPALEVTLRRLRAQQAEVRLPQLDDFIFLGVDGRPVQPYRLLSAFQRFAREADLPVITLHDARRTAVSLMIDEGVDVKVVATIVGHATTQTTVETYQTVRRTVQDAAMARYDARLGAVDAERM